MLEPHPTFSVTLNFAQWTTKIYLNSLEVAIGIAPEFALLSAPTDPHLAGMVPTNSIARPAWRKTLFLIIAVKGYAIKADEVVKAKPQVTFRILSNAPTLVGPGRRRRLLVVLKIERNQVVEHSTVVISQSAVTTTPYTALDGLRR